MWDQYIIGTDVVGFNDLLLPILISIHLVLLKEKLKDCTSVSVVGGTLFINIKILSFSLESPYFLTISVRCIESKIQADSKLIWKLVFVDKVYEDPVESLVQKLQYHMDNFSWSP